MKLAFYVLGFKDNYKKNLSICRVAGPLYNTLLGKTLILNTFGILSDA